MKIEFSPETPASDLIVLPVEKGGLSRIQFGSFDEAAQAVLMAAAKHGRFEGEAGSIVEAPVTKGTEMVRAALLGVGNGSEADYARAGGALTARYLTSGVTNLTIDFTALGGKPSAKAVAGLAANAAQRSWRIDTYRTKLKDDQRPTLATIYLVGTPDGANAAWGTAAAVTAGIELTKTLVSEPPNVIYPESFVERVTAEVAGLGLESVVLGEEEMRALGMGSLLGVAQGSARPPRLFALKWNGGGEGAPTVAFVGKGVTFDTGGISIKPAANMEDMKWDMAGAGAVAGAMKALAGRKARANVVGVMGLVENMPDGNAQRPGDIVTSMSGQTIEIINTDAEGRLVLADALTWTQAEFKPAVIIDLATLTGAMIVALGHEHAGLFTNDDGLGDQLLAAGKAAGDLLWRMPMSDAYNKIMDSPIADMKNSAGRMAGSITAAQFLERFVDKGVKWAHLDIAGTAWSDKAGPHHDKGATGYGVRLLDRFVADAFEQ